MSQYRCIPGPKNLVVNKAEDMDKAVAQYADLINNNCTNGWDFFSLEEVAVTTRPGCLAALFGARETTVMYNMLIFRKA